MLYYEKKKKINMLSLWALLLYKPNSWFWRQLQDPCLDLTSIFFFLFTQWIRKLLTGNGDGSLSSGEAIAEPFPFK